MPHCDNEIPCPGPPDNNRERCNRHAIEVCRGCGNQLCARCLDACAECLKVFCTECLWDHSRTYGHEIYQLPKKTCTVPGVNAVAMVVGFKC